jgi:hypothetical protein
MTRASAGSTLHTPGTYQLVMDPRLGLIVGTVTSPQTTPGVFGVVDQHSFHKSFNFSSAFGLCSVVIGAHCKHSL